MEFLKKLFTRNNHTDEELIANLSNSELALSKPNSQQTSNASQMIESYVKKEIRKYNIQNNEMIEDVKMQLGLHTYDDDDSRIVDLKNRDILFNECAVLVVQSQSGSTSNLQRRLNLGYNRVARIMDQLELAGVVGEANGSKAREVFFRTELELNEFLASLDDNLSNIAIPVDFYENNKYEIEQLLSEEKKKVDIQTKETLIHLQELSTHKIELEKEKIRKNFIEKERKKNLRKDVYKTLLEEGQISASFIENKDKREPIPQDIMDKVWNRDGGKCVKCGSQEKLEFDHIIPHSKGGANSYRNLQILCKKCNVEKSNKIG